MGILLTQSDAFLIGWIAKILGFIMNAIYNALSSIGIENIGLCIIIFTIITYTLMLPMTIKQQKFTRLSSAMNPEIQAIQKKYQNKKDQASMLKMQEETKMVYAKYGTSPTGGCLGTLIQFPILFALWPVIRNIPAYVTNVKDAYMPLVEKIMATDGFQKTMEKIGEAKPILISADKFDYSKTNTIIDVLYKFQESTWDTLAEKFPNLADLISSTESNVSNMNQFLGLNIAETPGSMFSAAISDFSIVMIIAALAIPVLAGLSQWVSMKLVQKTTNQSKNGSNDNEMVNQMNTMMNFMPLLSVFMCFSMPSGLGIYWIVSAVVRTIQQLIINRHLNKQPLDELIAENVKKAEKKMQSKNAVSRDVVNQRAHQSTRKTTSNYSGETYRKNAASGSLASKANMVSDFNKNNKK